MIPFYHGALMSRDCRFMAAHWQAWKTTKNTSHISIPHQQGRWYVTAVTLHWSCPSLALVTHMEVAWYTRDTSGHCLTGNIPIIPACSNHVYPLVSCVILENWTLECHMEKRSENFTNSSKYTLPIIAESIFLWRFAHMLELKNKFTNRPF